MLDQEIKLPIGSIFSHSSSASSNQASNSARSVGESASAARLISSTVLIKMKVSQQVNYRKIDFLLG
ncbi:MAG: hypothetical protein DME50_16795 [Verrucomicrobia bacterium]|nr:MAG: hypothetical protein DME50_16795 [Verrucomicrobiota bacterium]